MRPAPHPESDAPEKARAQRVGVMPAPTLPRRSAASRGRSPGPTIDTLAAPDALWRALRDVARGKRRRPDVATALFFAETAVADLSRRLRAGEWRPERLDVVAIRDPKPRVIVRPTVRDRVVHTALVQQLTPLFARSWTDDDFASRPGFGTHRAVLRLQRFTRRHRFALHLDVRAYFPSIDPARLQALVAARLRDAGVLAVVDALLAQGPPLYQNPVVRRDARLTDDWPPPGRGLPIGTAFSQFAAAHLYLNAFDHHVKRALKVPGYVRYCDDLFLFGDRRADLRAWRAAVAEWLWTERGLRLKHPEARILSCAGHVDGLGYRITRTDRRALPRARRNLARRIRAHARGEAEARLESSLAAGIGVLRF